MLCREGGRGRLKVQRFANDRRAARISARRAMVDMHLIPVKSCRYDASWEGAALVVSMGPTHEPIAASADLSHTSATSAASEVVFSLPPQVKDEPPATGHVPRRQDDDRPPRCCGNCTWQKFRLCTCQSSPNANTLIGLDDVCDVHSYSLFLRRAGEKDPRPQIESHTLPPGKSRTPIQTARNLTKQTPRDRNRSRPLAQGSRQRALCPHDDHGGKLFPVSSRGIQPHDADGVVYSADRGDRDRRCPGSNQLPKS